MRRALLFLLPAAAFLLPGRVLAGTAQGPSAGAHHLRSDPRSPAFIFGIKGGGESLTGPFTVTVYVGGSVKLTKKSPEGRIRLSNPRINIYPAGLHALLKLAAAEGFWSMPRSMHGKNTPADIASSFITIYTREGAKTVTVRGVNPSPFYELYAVLNYVAGATS